MAIIAVAVLALLVVGKTLLSRNGDVSAWGRLMPSGHRADQHEPTRVLIAPGREPAPTASYRCIVNGVLVYSGPEDCRPATEAARQQPVPRARAAVEPPADGLTPYQREMLRSADARIAREAVAAQLEMQGRQQRSAGTSGECSALAAEIVELDARARQPNSGSTQDHIRARRQEVRSRQAALRC